MDMVDVFYEFTRNNATSRDCRDTETLLTANATYYTGKAAAWNEVGVKLFGSDWQQKVPTDDKKRILIEFGFDLVKCGFE